MSNISWHVQNDLHMPVCEGIVYTHLYIFLKDSSKSVMYIKGHTRTEHNYLCRGSYRLTLEDTWRRGDVRAEEEKQKHDFLKCCL